MPRAAGPRSRLTPFATRAARLVAKAAVAVVGGYLILWVAITLLGAPITVGLIAVAGVVGWRRRYGAHTPGGGVRRRGDALTARGVAAGALGLVLAYLAVFVADAGALQALLLIGAVAGGLAARELLGKGTRHRAGAGGERSVGDALRGLEGHGWRVEHSVAKPHGGDVDHVAHGPHGELFTIETKTRASGAKELDQARSHARWAARHYKTVAIPVLCVTNRPQRPTLREGVWCTDVRRLPDVLTSRA
jgi:hypothetical protein